MSDDPVRVEVDEEFLVDGRWPDAVEYEIDQTGDSRVYQFFGEDNNDE